MFMWKWFLIIICKAIYTFLRTISYLCILLLSDIAEYVVLRFGFFWFRTIASIISTDIEENKYALMIYFSLYPLGVFCIHYFDIRFWY